MNDQQNMLARLLMAQGQGPSPTMPQLPPELLVQLLQQQQPQQHPPLRGLLNDQYAFMNLIRPSPQPTGTDTIGSRG